MENIDNTGEKKNDWAAMREKYNGQISDLQSQLEAERAARAADKKLYFNNTMKSRGYEGNFDEFADKYSGLDINDMVALYEGQNGKSVVKTEPASTVDEPQQTPEPTIGAKSVIAGANPTTGVGEKKMSEMSSDELIKFARTQPWYNN